jgi:hypothetical protein
LKLLNIAPSPNRVRLRTGLSVGSECNDELLPLLEPVELEDVGWVWFDSNSQKRWYLS